MSFVRAFIGRDSGEVQHVMESSVPFPNDGPPPPHMLNDRGEPTGEELVAVDFGWMEPPQGDYTTLEGRPCSPARHVFDRVKGRPAPNPDELQAHGLPRFHDCPCSLNGIRARLRAGGPQAIPATPRAMLANVLPPDQVAAMGIDRDLPLSALRAAETLRNRRDPNGGSRYAVLERQIDELATARKARWMHVRETIASQIFGKRLEELTREEFAELDRMTKGAFARRAKARSGEPDGPANAKTTESEG